MDVEEDAHVEEDADVEEDAGWAGGGPWDVEGGAVEEANVERSALFSEALFSEAPFERGDPERRPTLSDACVVEVRVLSVLSIPVHLCMSVGVSRSPGLNAVSGSPWKTRCRTACRRRFDDGRVRGVSAPPAAPVRTGLTAGVAVCRAAALAAVAFSGLQKELDKQGLEILENQQESIATRKQLADLTRGTPPPPPTPSAPRPCLLPWAVFPGLNRDFAPQQTTKRRPKRRRLRRSRRF